MSKHTSELKDKVRLEVDRLKDKLLSVSDAMYSEPEIGLQEFKSSAKLVDLLKSAGFTVETGLADMPTSFKAVKKGKSGGPTLAILAEYDALPEIGHGCGHNIIGTAATGAGMALASVMDDVQGTLIVFGSPAEEGAVDGGRQGPSSQRRLKGVDAAIMFHPSQKEMCWRSNASRHGDNVRGKTAHGGAPHRASTPRCRHPDVQQLERAAPAAKENVRSTAS